MRHLAIQSPLALDARVTPAAVGQASVGEFAISGGAGVTTVGVYDSDGKQTYTIDAFTAAESPGGVRVAMADVNGDKTADLIAAAGPGGQPQVRIFDGATRELAATIDAFESSFTGGLYVAAGDVNGDGKADIAITPDQGGGPRVRVIDGDGGKQINDFFGIEDPNFRGGARAAFGDLDGDGNADLLVAAGFGGGPRLAGFDGAGISSPTPPKLFDDFFVFEQTLRNGVFIASGDINGDNFDDVIVGGGPGGGPRVFAASGKDLLGSGSLTTVANFFAGDPSNRGGIRVAVKDLDGDSRADLLAAAGTNAPPRLTIYAGRTIPAEGTPADPSETLIYDATYTGGVFVG